MTMTAGKYIILTLLRHQVHMDEFRNQIRKQGDFLLNMVRYTV